MLLNDYLKYLHHKLRNLHLFQHRNQSKQQISTE